VHEGIPLLSSRLGGVALTRYMDGRMDRQGDSYILPKNFVCGGYNKRACHIKLRKLSFKKRYERGNHNQKEEDRHTTQWPKKKVYLVSATPPKRLIRFL
jgi:hypothetical protein